MIRTSNKAFEKNSNNIPTSLVESQLALADHIEHFCEEVLIASCAWENILDCRYIEKPFATG